MASCKYPASLTGNNEILESGLVDYAHRTAFGNSEKGFFF